MNELKKLLEQRAELQKQMEELLDAAKKETRALNEEEVAKFDDLEKQRNSIDETIERENRARATQTKLNVIDGKTAEAKEEAEIRAFENFVRGKAGEFRADEIQLTQGNNGSIIPTSIANRIITKVRDMVPFLQIANVINTSGKLSIPVYAEDNKNYINAGYIDEGTALTDNIGKFSTVDLTGYVIGALSLVSNKLVTNTDINVTDFVVNEVARAIAEKLEKEFVVGTTNKITGITSQTAGVTLASKSAITYDELVTIKHKLNQRFRKNAVWLMNDSTYTTICKLKDSEGRPYFKDDDYMILGSKVIVSESFDELGATSKKPIVYADMSGYTIKGAKTVEIQVLREKYADRNLLGVIGYAEYDAKISDAKKIVTVATPAS